MFELKNISKQFHGEYALRDVSLSIGRGLHFLTGPSGSGKTTLLNLLAGFDTDYSGDIAAGGALLRELDEGALCRCRRDNIGFVFQNYHLLAGYTALENVCLARSPVIDPAEAEKQAISILGRLFLKMDSHLAIAGSIKARGGIYEVLKHAEDLALAGGKLVETDSYEVFAGDEMQKYYFRTERSEVIAALFCGCRRLRRRAKRLELNGKRLRFPGFFAPAGR